MSSKGMYNIIIDEGSKTQDGWQFQVIVGDHEYAVDVDESYWKKLIGGKKTPRELVEASFEFLLEREPPSSILATFTLQTIQKYFSEYEDEMKKLG